MTAPDLSEHRHNPDLLMDLTDMPQVMETAARRNQAAITDGSMSTADSDASLMTAASAVAPNPF